MCFRGRPNATAGQGAGSPRGGQSPPCGKGGVVRPRFAVLASVLTALAAVAVPAMASAAPPHNRGLTINGTPNPILAGEGVFIFGRGGGGTAGEAIPPYHN